MVTVGALSQISFPAGCGNILQTVGGWWWLSKISSFKIGWFSLLFPLLTRSLLSGLLLFLLMILFSSWSASSEISSAMLGQDDDLFRSSFPLMTSIWGRQPFPPPNPRPSPWCSRWFSRPPSFKMQELLRLVGVWRLLLADLIVEVLLDPVLDGGQKE